MESKRSRTAYAAVEQARRLIELAGKATEGEWDIYNSCSWHRIGLKFRNRTIIEPVVCSDGHPDLSGKNLIDDLTFIAFARTAAVAVAAALIEAEGRIAELEGKSNAR